MTGDHLVARDVNEQSIDGDRVAMVMKDVATMHQVVLVLRLDGGFCKVWVFGSRFSSC